MNAQLLALGALVICWSILPSMKIRQLKGLSGLHLLVVHQGLCFLFGLIALALFGSKDVVGDIRRQSREWWGLSCFIALIASLSGMLYIVLTGKTKVDFIAYAKPLSMILTFVVAMWLGEGGTWNSNKTMAMLLIAAGMWFFQR